MAVLLLAEHDNKVLAPATAKALTAARAFGGGVWPVSFSRTRRASASESGASERSVAWARRLRS